MYIDDRVKHVLIFFGIIVLVVVSLMFNKNFRINKYITEEYEPKFIVNDLYKSKEINYRLALNEEEKAMYEKIINNLIVFEKNFEIDLSSYFYDHSYEYFDKIGNLFSMILMDHPELIHVGTISYSVDPATGIVIISPEYVMSSNDYNNNVIEIKNIINSVKEATKDMNEFEKIKYVYDFIGKSNQYGDIEDLRAQSAYSAFSSNLSPVCAGYSKASEILFNNIGIKSLLIHGESEYALFLGIPHAWNIVSIDESFYLYDVTMSSNAQTEQLFYSGFLINGKKHSPSIKKTYPYLNGLKYKEIYLKNN